MGVFDVLSDEDDDRDIFKQLKDATLVPSHSTVDEDRVEALLDGQEYKGNNVPQPVRQVQGENPDEVASNKLLAESAGLPPASVSDEATAQQVKDFMAERTMDRQLEGRTATQRFLSNPYLASVGKDDVQNLTFIEEVGRSMGRIAAGFERGTTQEEMGQAAFELVSKGGTARAQQFADIKTRLEALGEEQESDATSYFAAAAEFFGQQVERMTTEDNLALIAGGTATGATIGATGGAFLGPGAVLTTAAGTVAGFSAGVASVFMKDTLANEGALSYLEQVEAGVDPEIAKWTGLGVGILTAALEAAGAKVLTAPLSAAAKRIIRKGINDVFKKPTLREAAAKFALHTGSATGVEVITEVGQELVQIAGMEIGKAFTPGEFESISQEELLERLEKVAIKTFKGALVLGAGGGSITIAMDARDASKARELNEAQNQLHQAVAASKIKERDPAAIAAHIDTVFEDADIRDVAISGDAMVAFSKSQGMTLGDLAAEIGIEDQIDEVQNMNSDFILNKEQFTKHVLMSEQFETVQGDIRYDPADMTFNEAEEFDASGAQQDLDNEIDRAEEMTALDEELGIDPSEDQPGFLEADDIADFDENTQETIEREVAAEVQIAEREMGTQGLFTSAHQIGMTDNAFTSYMVAVANAAQASVKRATARAAKRAKRRLQTQWKEERAALTEPEGDAYREVQEQPVYRVLSAIGREVEEGFVESDLRMNRDMVVALMGGDPRGLKDLPRSNGKLIYTENGIDPNILADLYGSHENGDIMLFDMIQSGPFNEAVEAKADQMMNERHGAILGEIAMHDDAIRALYNDDTAALIAIEIEALRGAKKAGRLKPALLRKAAKNRLRKYNVKDIKPHKFINEARRLSKIAERLFRSGDLTGAADVKYQQLLQHQMAQESYVAQDKFKAQHKFLNKFNSKKKKFGILPPGHLDMIRALLQDYGLGDRLSDSTSQRLEAWKADQLTEGDAVGVAELGERKHFSKLTQTEWEQFHDTVKAIQHAGNQQAKFLNDAEKSTRAEIVANITEKLIENRSREREDVSSIREWARDGKEFIAATMLNMDTVLREIDGFQEFGPAYVAIKGGIDKAVYQGYHEGQVGLAQRQKAEAEMLKKLFSVYDKAERVAMAWRLKIPGVSKRVKKEAVIAVVLNSGNQGNRDAMVDSGQYTEGEIDAILDFATEKDWEFAQSVWDYFDTFRPELKESVERRQGFTPEFVEATPVRARHGKTYRGGYYPIRYDTKKSIIPRKKDRGDLMTAMRYGEHVLSHTRRGHTIERTKNQGKYVSLNLHVITSHVDQVIYDLEMGDAVNDSYKVLHDRDMKKAFEDAGRRDTHDLISVWLEDVAVGEMRHKIESILRHVRTGFTVSKLAWNFNTAAIQILGMTQTAADIGVVATADGFLRMISHTPGSAITGNGMTQGNVFRFVREQSTVMAQREDSFNKDIVDASRALSQSLLVKWTPGNSAEIALTSFFWAMKKMQRFVDVATWLGAFHKAIKDPKIANGDRDLAVQYADRKVIRTQGSGNFQERSGIERGSVGHVQQSETIKMWSTLISYFIAKNNIAWEKTKGTNFKSIKEVLQWSSDMALLYVVEAAVVSLMRGELPDEDSPDDESALEVILQRSVGTLGAGIPFVREATSAMEGFPAGGYVGSLGNELGKAVQAYGLAKENEEDLSLSFWKAANNMGGAVFRYPSGAINKAASAHELMLEGEDISIWEYFTGPEYDKY